MQTHYTDKPLSRLPLTKGMADSVLNFGARSKDALLVTGTLPSFMRQAIQNPGVLQVRYHEENWYEYEDRATYDPENNTMTTNLYCPFSYGHHVGSTCSCCGQKD